LVRSSTEIAAGSAKIAVACGQRRSRIGLVTAARRKDSAQANNKM
jgi:hypothetical protein